MGLIDPPGFRRNRLGQVWLHLPKAERTLMADLLEQLSEMLAPDEPSQATPDPLAELVGIEPSAHRPEDPALARLFPDAYADRDLADEFRRFTQRELRDAKLANLRLASDSLSRAHPTQLTPEECRAWLGALNDLRLALGTRLGVEEGNDEEFLDLPEDDPRHVMYLIYDWLTYHQDRLVRALDR
ncbi:MAG: DUF2017 domain-containing protein [Candidatus Nanopelagicales bacterium]